MKGKGDLEREGKGERWISERKEIAIYVLWGSP
jgi:hypothetical protein